MTESLADRWIRDFEAKYPEKVEAMKTTCFSTNTSQPTRTMPSPPSVVPNTCLSPPRSDEQWKVPTATPDEKSIQNVVQSAVALRRQLGLTQSQCAHRLGISSRTWQEWEQGRRMPSGVGRALLERWVSEQL